MAHGVGAQLEEHPQPEGINHTRIPPYGDILTGMSLRTAEEQTGQRVDDRHPASDRQNQRAGLKQAEQHEKARGDQ